MVLRGGRGYSEVRGAWCGYGLGEEFAGASLWMRQRTAGEAVVLSVVGARCDTGTLYVPEQVSWSRVGSVGSCGTLAGQRRRAKQELSCGEVFDDVHGPATDRAVPERCGAGMG
jgi:hypothetical protein